MPVDKLGTTTIRETYLDTNDFNRVIPSSQGSTNSRGRNFLESIQRIVLPLYRGLSG